MVAPTNPNQISWRKIPDSLEDNNCTDNFTLRMSEEAKAAAATAKAANARKRSDILEEYLTPLHNKQPENPYLKPHSGRTIGTQNDAGIQQDTPPANTNSATSSHTSPKLDKKLL